MPNMAVGYFEFCDVVLVTKNDKYPYYCQLGRPVPRKAVIRQKNACAKAILPVVCTPLAYTSS